MNELKYRAVPGAKFDDATADAVGRAIEGAYDDDERVGLIIEMATDPQSPLHGLITWDAEEAAYKYWSLEASCIVNCLLTRNGTGEWVRAFQCVTVTLTEEVEVKSVSVSVSRHYVNAETLTRNQSAAQVKLIEGQRAFASAIAAREQLSVLDFDDDGDDDGDTIQPSFEDLDLVAAFSKAPPTEKLKLLRSREFLTWLQQHRGVRTVDDALDMMGDEGDAEFESYLATDARNRARKPQR